MSLPAFHHVQLTVSDVERARQFYAKVVGLTEIKRPNFPVPGAWFQFANGQELHLAKLPEPIWPGMKVVNRYEAHLAFRIASFKKAVESLRAHGYSDEFSDDHPMKMLIKTENPNGYPQLYFLDPDRHMIEFNAAVLD